MEKDFETLFVTDLSVITYERIKKRFRSIIILHEQFPLMAQAPISLFKQ